MSNRRARTSCIGGAELATAARSFLWLEQVCRKSHLSATLQQRRQVNTSVMCSSTNCSCGVAQRIHALLRLKLCSVPCIASHLAQLAEIRMGCCEPGTTLDICTGCMEQLGCGRCFIWELK